MKVINSVFEREEVKLTEMLGDVIMNCEMNGFRCMNVAGDEMQGYLFGNDEMYDNDEFYQLLAAYGSNKIYKVYFDVDVNSFDSFDDVDYSKPYKMVLSEYYTK